MSEDNIRKKLIVGNWKMFNNITDSIKLITNLKNQAPEFSEIIPVIAPPFTSLYSVSIALQETPFKLAGQNCHWEEEGPFTGEISAPFLKDVGCDYVLIGHSERRQYFGETNESVNKKIHAALASELIPIFCIGENLKERQEGKTFQVLDQQLKKGLQDITLHDLENFVIAYEPVWAIGTGENASPLQVAEAHHYIRNFLAKHYDAPTADQVSLLYGGSVKPNNIAELMMLDQVDGVLVGGASIDADQFTKILNYQEPVKN